MRGRMVAIALPWLALLLAFILLAGCAPGAALTQALPTVAPPSAAIPAATATPTALPATAPAAASPPAVAPSLTVIPSPVAATTQLWWNDRVFYEIFVRSFADSDGDGVGDFKGLTSKLDYLNDGDPHTTNDLGVTGLWLMPINPSPSYHGYDVTDYKAVNPEYGTMEDFKEFLDAAHRRGIKVIIDLVMNHTSSQHPWFKESLDPDSPKRDWYIWSADPSGQGWHDAGQKEKYYGYFGDHMPDLNYNNPEVTDAMFDVVKFWLEDVKIDGFRLDAIKYLVEQDGKNENAGATFDWLEKFHSYYKSLNPDAFTVGEAWADSSMVARYVPDKVDVAFEFNMADGMVKSVNAQDRFNVEYNQTETNRLYPPGQFASFLTNHDMNRVRSRLGDDAAAALAASLYLLYPGVPFIYYGEEIGMQGVKPDEDIRLPMQWTADGGFTTGKPWRPYFEDFETRNVAAEDLDPNSLLSRYRDLIRLRNTFPALRIGDWRLVAAPKEAPAVYSFMRSQGDERFLVLFNLGDKPVTDYALSLQTQEGAHAPAKSAKAELVYGPKDAMQKIPVITTDGFEGYKPIPNLPPYSTFVIRYSP